MNNIWKLLLVVIVVIFLVMVLASSNGYYEYELNKQSNLTEEAIKQFEQDIKDGKEIDVEDYLVKENKDYSNSFSKTGIKISNKISDIFKKTFKFMFDALGGFLDE